MPQPRASLRHYRPHPSDAASRRASSPAGDISVSTDTRAAPTTPTDPSVPEGKRERCCSTKGTF
jgi:hypothetical protein